MCSSLFLAPKTTTENYVANVSPIKYRARNVLICNLEFTLDPYYTWANKNEPYSAYFRKLMLIVLQVNRIFEKYDFAGKKVLFRLQNIIRLDPIDENGPGPQKKMPSFVLDYVPKTSKEYLEMYSHHLNSMCASILVHQFTFQNPEDKVPGDAYRKQGQFDGACSKVVDDRQKNGVLLNSGGSKGRYYTSFMALNLAHYLAALLGAPVDKECPEMSIMHPNARNITPSDIRFSQCTVEAISEQVSTGIFTCFKSLTPVCGNGYLEPGEGKIKRFWEGKTEKESF